MISRTLAVARKELHHILRDPRTLAIMFLLPIIQLLLLGYAATTDISQIHTAVLDGDRTAQSRSLVASYQASGSFEIVAYAGSEDELAGLLDSGQARLGLIILPGFARDLARGGTAQVGALLDGSDPTVASTVMAATQSVGQQHGLELLQERLGQRAFRPPIEVRPQVWYNPELRSSNFFIPALMAVLLQLLATLLTALAVVREREQGTLEQLIVTPIRPIELVLGKVTPYVGVAFFHLLEVLVVGVVWFEVPVHGSVGLLLVLASLFLVTSLGMGLLISTVTRTQMEAMLLTFLVVFPAIFLSGFIFPIEAMPGWLQAVAYVIPLRYLLVIIRGIILKGVGLGVLWDDVLALAAFAVLILLLTASRFRKRLE